MKQCWGKDKGDGVQGVFAVGEPEKVAAVEKILEQSRDSLDFRSC